MIRLTLPVPPSLNHAFANAPGIGRVKTKAYKAWITGAGWHLKAQGPLVPLIGEVTVEIRIGLRGNRGDVDNRVKGVLDLLVRHHIIEDDRKVRKVSAEWADDIGACEVTIYPVSSAVMARSDVLPSRIYMAE